MKVKRNNSVNSLEMKNSKQVFKETFGIGKGKIKKSGQEFKDEVKRDLYND